MAPRKKIGFTILEAPFLRGTFYEYCTEPTGAKYVNIRVLRCGMGGGGGGDDWPVLVLRGSPRSKRSSKEKNGLTCSCFNKSTGRRGVEGSGDR